jgi:hypothetical protein
MLHEEASIQSHQGVVLTASGASSRNVLNNNKRDFEHMR